MRFACLGRVRDSKCLPRLISPASDESSVMSVTRYPLIEVAGAPYELGTQLGEAAREQIRGFHDVVMERVNKTVRISHEAALNVAQTAIAKAEAFSPRLVEEMRGCAAATGITLADLMLLNIRNQLQSEQPAEAGCTSVSMAAGPRGARILAQNWDSDPALDPFTIVLIRRPQGLPAHINVTQAGLIGYIGMNDRGVGLCLNALPAPSRRTGVPHYFLVRTILEQSSRDGILAAIEPIERVIPASIMLTTPEGPANLEITLDAVHVETAAAGAAVAHTNHCQHPALQPVNRGFPELIQSYARKQRIDELAAPAASGLGLREQVQTALRDHQGYPQSICRHVNDDPKHGFWQTVFSVVMEPDAQRIWVSRGTPCDHPYEAYALS